jgi:hypothetical protein
MIRRNLQETIAASLANFPVVGLLGSRQVGKTTLAQSIRASLRPDAVYLDLELPSDFNKLQDPELYLGQYENRLVIIDEIQRLPLLFPVIRALIDRRRIGGRFLLLGSASPTLIRHASETLAGRIIYHELSPLDIFEIEKRDFSLLFLRGGYPLSYLAAGDEESHRWREAFIRTYLEMDIPQLGIHIPAVQLRRFWTMIAHSHGQLWNASKVAGSLGMSAPTIRRYLDILEDTFVIRQLQPYHFNIKKRLVKSPKVYIRDSGLLHALLNIHSLDELQGHPSLGSSWEGFVIEQIISLLGAKEVYFYRTNAGAEIDLLFFDDKRDAVAVEVKYSLSPSLSRGFRNAFDDLGCSRGYVVYPGNDRYPLSENVHALPITGLAEIKK